MDAVLRAMVARMMILPVAEPPSDRRANLAVALAPVFVVVLFTLIVSGLIAFDTGVAIFLACTAWVIYEMFGYQRAVDSYHQQWLQGENGGGFAAAGNQVDPSPSDAPRGSARARFNARGTLQFEPSRL